MPVFLAGLPVPQKPVAARPSFGTWPGSLFLRVRLITRNEQGNSPDQCNNPNDRRKRDSVFFICRYLNRTQIDGLLLSGIGEPLICQREDSDDHKDNPEDGCCFHVSSF